MRKYYIMSMSDVEPSSDDVAKDMDVIWSKLFDVMHLSCQFSSSKGEFSHIGPNIVNPKCNDLAMGVFNDASSTIDFNQQRVKNSLSLLQNRREMYLKSSVNRLESILISKAKSLGECQTHVITRKERLRTQNITSEDRLRDLILEVYGEYGKSAIRCIRRGDYVENMSLLNMIWLVYKLRWERFMLRLYKDAADDGDHNRGSVQHTIMCPKAHSDEFNQLSFKSRKIALGLLNNNGEGVSKGGGHGGEGGGITPESIQVLSIIRIHKGSASSASSMEIFPKQPKLFENRMSLGSLVEHIRQIMPTNSKARVGSANASAHGDEGGSSSSGKSSGHGGPGLRRPRERVDRDKDGSGVSDTLPAEGSSSSSTSITPKSRLGKLCRYLKSMSIDWMQPTSLQSFYKMQPNNTNSSSLNSSRKADSEVAAAESTGTSKPKKSTENSGIISGLLNSLVGTGGSSGSSSSNKPTAILLNSNISMQTSSSGTSDAANSVKSHPLTNLVEVGNISPIFSPSTGGRNVVSMPHLESLEKLTKKQFVQTNIAWDRIYFCIEERYFALRCNSLSSSKSPSGNLSEEDCDGYIMMAFLEVIQSEVLSKLPKNSETSYNLSQLSSIREALNRLHNLDDRSKIEVLPFKKLNVSKDKIKSHLPGSLSAEALDVAASKILLLLKGFPDIVRINIGGMYLHFSSACVANLAELRNSFVGAGAESTSIHGFPRAQFMNQCPHPWLPLLITPETFLLDSLYIVSTCLSPPSTSSSVSSTDRSSPQPDGALYTLVPLHDICTHELTKHALCLDNSSNTARSTLANVNSSCNIQFLNNFTLLVPDSARSRLTVGTSSSDASSSSSSSSPSSLLSLNEKSLATGDVDKFLSSDLFHKYMIFADEFTNFKKSSGDGAPVKAIVQKCIYLVQIFVNRDGTSPDINPTDHGCLVDNHILRTAIALRNYQSVVLGSAKLSHLAGSDSVRKLANLSEVEHKENSSKQDYTSNSGGNNNYSTSSSSSSGSKEKDWDRSVMSTICRWRSCICESILGKSDNAISSHQMPPLCYFHFQLKAFMDSSSERVYGDSNNFLPKRAPNIPKHITVDALAKFEIITKNVISEGRPFNIITSQHGNAISDSIAPALDNSDEQGGEREGSTSQDTRRETSAAANRVGWKGVSGRPQAAGGSGGVAPLSLSKHNLSKTLSERSRDMYIIRAASSLLQELWDGKLKGTLQVFIKKVISEFAMKARLEAKLNSYKNAMIFYTNRVARITHPHEAKLLLMTQGKDSSPGKVKFANKGTIPVGPATKVSPRGKKTVLFQNQSMTNIGLSSTYNTLQSATKFRASLPSAPTWAVWKIPKRAATVIEMQMELERDYVELLKKEQCVSLEMRQFLMYKLYPTTEVNVIRKEQKLLKEAIEFKVENQEILPLSHLTQHQGGIGKDKDDGGQVDASRREESSQAAGSPGRDNSLASSQLLSNLSYYQSMKLLASMEGGFTEKKLFILAQKRSECDEMHERSALQQQKMLQALNKEKSTKDSKTAGAHGSKSVDKSGNRPDPAAFSLQSRF